MVLLVDTFRDAPDCFWGTMAMMKKRPKAPQTAAGDAPSGPDPIQRVQVMMPSPTDPSDPRTEVQYAPVTIIWDFTSQHTVRWEKPWSALVDVDIVHMEKKKDAKGSTVVDESGKAVLEEVVTRGQRVVTINPGSCNLYTFPKVTWTKPKAEKKKGFASIVSAAVAADKKASEVLVGAELKALQLLFLQIARSPTERDVLRLPDPSGANSVLGMLVANTKGAIDTVVSIFKE